MDDAADSTQQKQDPDLYKQYYWQADGEKGMFCLMPEQHHPHHCPQTASHQWKKQQNSFWNPPFFLSGSLLVPLHKQQTQRIDCYQVVP